MAGISILRNLLLKQAIKESGQASGIMSIGDSVRKLAERRLQSYLVSAANKGIDLDKFNESQIKYMLEMNQPYNRAKMQLRKEDAMKSADVLDMKGRKLDKDKPIMGGTQDDLDKKADGGRIGYRDGPTFNFAATGSKSGKQQIEKAPAGITRDQETFQAIMNADIPLNDKLNFLANLQYGKDRVRIDADDQELALFEGGFKDREFGLGYNEGEEGLSGRVMYNIDTNEPEFKIGFSKKFADGGRAGFKSGLGMKFLKFLNENNPVQAYKKYLKSVKDRTLAGKEAEVAGEVIPIAAGGALITNQLKKKLKSMNEEQKKKIKEEALAELREDKAYGGRIGLKDGFPSREENLRLLKEELKEIFRKQTDPFPKPGGKEFKNFKLGLENILSKSRPKNAGGGRAGFFLGSRNPKGLGLLREILNYMSKKGKETGGFKGIDLSGLDMLRLSNPKRFNKLLEDVRGKVNIKEGIMGTDTVRAQQQSLRGQRKGLTAEALQVAKDIKAKDIKIKRRIAEEAENTIIPRIKKQLMESMGMSEEAAEKTARGMAEAAQNMRLPDDPPIITKEGILELENVLKNLETGGKKKRDLNADGGRVGLKDGMDRRTFLKIMGGLASIPILGKFFKGAKVATGTKVASDVASTVSKSTPPPYFFELANKIKSLGKPDKVTYADRVEIHRYTGKNGDEYELVEDLSTGDIKITKDKLGAAGSGDETYEGVMDRSVMEYKKGDVNVDPDKNIASKAPDEYDEYRVEFDVDGTEADADNISEVIRKEIIEEANQQAPKIKKAGGGVAYMLGE